MQVVAAGRTDAGQVRSRNEDQFAVLVPETQNRGWDALLVVADGMGGHRSGDVASHMVVDRVLQLGSELDSADSRDMLTDISCTIRDANRNVLGAASRQPALRGMGSTVTAAVVADNHLYIGHVGDSRAYLIREGQVYQLTHDHSWVADEVRSGRLSSAAAAHHPDKNLLTRAVGAKADLRVETRSCEVQRGDVLVLCTDGLSGMLDDAELAQLAVAYGQPEVAAERLITAAKKRGAPDNVTAIVARLVGRLDQAQLESGPATVEIPRRRRRRQPVNAPRRMMLVAVILLLVILGAVIVTSTTNPTLSHIWASAGDWLTDTAASWSRAPGA